MSDGAASEGQEVLVERNQQHVTSSLCFHMTGKMRGAAAAMAGCVSLHSVFRD
jgi:hypothetical protein